MDGIRQHKGMAMSGKVPGEAGDFGVEKFAEMNGGMKHPDREMSHEMMGDGERGIGKHVARGRGKMPAQAHPDHGPHHHKMGGEADFGTGGFPR